MAQWVSMADRLIGLADEDAARGRNFAASDKLERAALYLLVAERMQAQGSPGRAATYARALSAFERSTTLGRLNRERVEIPLQHRHHARAADTRRRQQSRARPSSIGKRPRQLRRAAVLVTPAHRAGTPRCVHAVRRSSPAAAKRCAGTTCLSIRTAESWASRAVDWPAGTRRRRCRAASA
jgi:hypothetical protein